MIDKINKITRVILKSIKQVYDFISTKSIYYGHKGRSLLSEVTLNPYY